MRKSTMEREICSLIADKCKLLGYVGVYEEGTDYSNIDVMLNYEHSITNIKIDSKVTVYFYFTVKDEDRRMILKRVMENVGKIHNYFNNGDVNEYLMTGEENQDYIFPTSIVLSRRKKDDENNGANKPE